jgi:flagellar hook-associated protein 2
VSVNSIMGALGAGSGIDIKGLAESLTDVERKPRTEAIEGRITKSESRISGYSAVMFGLKQLKDAFSSLSDRSDFNGATIRNSQPTVVQATADAKASLGQHSVQVNELAQGTIRRSDEFDANTVFNGGAPFSFTIQKTVGAGPNPPSPVTISVSSGSLSSVVSAINSKVDQTGVEARLVNTGESGTPLTIVLTGESGRANDFEVIVPNEVAGLGFGTELQAASDATAVIDGITITRPTNVIDDVIPGVKLELLARSSPQPGSAATLSVARDTAPVKEKITALVEAYNNLQDFLDTLGDPDSDDEEFGGVLANDSLLRFVRDQARSMVTATSSTPSGNISALRDMGVTLDREGRLQVDATKLDVTLLARFEDVAKAFTADAENLTLVGDQPRGIGGDALKRLDTLMGRDGPIVARSNSAQSQLSKAQEDLAELEERMDGIYERYLEQFAAMDSLVSQLNQLRESLSGQFENLSAMYNNN